MVGDKILIGNVTLENFLIFIFISLLTVVAGSISYALIRRLFDDRLSLRDSKLIARVIEYSLYTLGFYYGLRYVLNLDLNALIASLGIFSYGGIKNPPPFEGGDELIPTLLNMTP